MNNNLKKEFLKKLHCEVRYNELMSRHTSLKIGGKADYLIFPKNSKDVRKIIHLSKSNNIPLMAIGGGTNLLVRDKGIRGIVLCLNKGFHNIEIVTVTDRLAHVFIGAGCKLSKLMKFCAENGFGGIDCLAGIPGTVGGGITMNAGTKDGEIKDLIHTIHIMEATGKINVIDSPSAGFTYRESNFPKGSIILGGEFVFRKVGKKVIENKIEAILAERKKSQNIFLPSAGCIFKNPEGGKAYQLIDEINMRGEQIGGAQVSKKHSNYIVNKENASAKDVIRLINLIKRRVKSKKGITLHLEINIIGETVAKSR